MLPFFLQKKGSTSVTLKKKTVSCLAVAFVTLIKIVQLLKNCQAVESSRKLPDAMKTLETLKLIPETPMSVLSFFLFSRTIGG